MASALDSNSLYAAKKMIDKLEKRVMEATLECGFTMRDLVECMFAPDIISRCSAAYGIVYDEPSQGRYVFNIDITHKVSIEIIFNELEILPPASNVLQQGTLSTPILRTFCSMMEVCQKFNDVRAVLNWLASNATAGAMRYYWPTALSLCSDVKLHQENGKRCNKEPVGISEWLTRIRDTSGTIASALMTPENKNAIGSPVIVSFSGEFDSNTFDLFPDKKLDIVQ
jgi:hypothetical protein